MLAVSGETWALALVPIFATAFLAVLGWVLTKIVQVTQAISAIQAEVRAAERERGTIRREFDERLVRLEAWRDGYKTGTIAGANGN